MGGSVRLDAAAEGPGVGETAPERSCWIFWRIVGVVAWVRPGAGRVVATVKA